VITSDSATPNNSLCEVTLAVHGSLAAVFGVVTGATAGLIGVGGGEFRILFCCICLVLKSKQRLV
jgi:uncharacterized membrane protein YfcA